MLKPNLALFVLLGACTSSGSDGTATSEVRGSATFRDAATDHAGNPQPAAAPTESARLSLVIHGSGQWSATDLDLEVALSDTSVAYDGVAAVRWTVLGTAIDVAGADVSVVLPYPGTFTVRQQVTDGDGSIASDDFTIEVAGSGLQLVRATIDGN